MSSSIDVLKINHTLNWWDLWIMIQVLWTVQTKTNHDQNSNVQNQ